MFRPKTNTEDLIAGLPTAYQGYAATGKAGTGTYRTPTIASQSVRFVPPPKPAVKPQNVDASGRSGLASMAVQPALWAGRTVRDLGSTIQTGANAVVSLPSAILGNRMSDQANKMDRDAETAYRSGTISKDEYLKRLEVSAQLGKDSGKAFDVHRYFGSGVTADGTATTPMALPMQANGDLDTQGALVRVISGGVTLMPLKIPGLGSASSFVFKGLENAGVKMFGKKFFTESVKELDKIAISKGVQTSLSEKIAATAAYHISEVPGLKQMAERYAAQYGTKVTTAAFGRDLITELAIRAPMRRENIRFVQDTLDALKEDKWLSNGDKLGFVPSSILIAGMALEGGPLGFLARNLNKAGAAFKIASYGEREYLDELARALQARGFTGSLPQAIKEIMETGTQSQVYRLPKQLKSLTATNLQGRGAVVAAEASADAIMKSMGRTGTITEAIQHSLDWQYAQEVLEPFNKVAYGKGVYLLAARYSKDTEKELTGRIVKSLTKNFEKLSKLEGAEKLVAAKKLVNKIIDKEVKKGAYWTQSDAVVTSIRDAVNSAKGFTSLKNVARAPSAAVLKHTKSSGLLSTIPKEVREQLAKSGYTVVESDTVTRKLITTADAKDVVLKSQYVPVGDPVFQQAATAKPYFRAVGSALTKAGLGLEESSQIAYRMVRDNATFYLDEALGKGRGASVLNALQQHVENGGAIARTATDLRMLTVREIQGVMKKLGYSVSKGEASAVKNAIIQAHVDAPLAVTGMANYLVDRSYKFNPLYKGYARMQGAFRYSWNPFFRTQEIAETELLGQALSNGKKPWLFGMGALMPERKTELDAIVKVMDNSGMFNDGMVATRFGEGATDVFLGRLTAQITQTQKRTLATVVEKMAQKYGMSVEDVISARPQEVMDMLRPIIQYPTKGALNSNLLKALNIAIFPSRYNIKVATLAAKTLAAQPPAVQALTINKLWEFENWIKSPEGIAWYQENNTAIQFFRWLTPVGSIQWVFDTLSMPFNDGPKSVADLGSIGGLPFGVISQILDSQGLIRINTPYVSPETGDIYSKNIPDSMKARVASALMDLLGSTFTYPGAQIGLDNLGLPSKSKLLRTAASTVAGTEAEEWNKIIYTTEDLSPLTQRQQEIWSGTNAAKEGRAAPVLRKPGEVPKPNLTFDVKAPEGRQYTKSEINAVNQAEKDAKAAAAKAKTVKPKTTTFQPRP